MPNNHYKTDSHNTLLQTPGRDDEETFFHRKSNRKSRTPLLKTPSRDEQKTPFCKKSRATLLKTPDRDEQKISSNRASLPRGRSTPPPPPPRKKLHRHNNSLTTSSDGDNQREIPLYKSRTSSLKTSGRDKQEIPSPLVKPSFRDALQFFREYKQNPGRVIPYEILWQYFVEYKRRGVEPGFHAMNPYGVSDLYTTNKKLALRIYRLYCQYQQCQQYKSIYTENIRKELLKICKETGTLIVVKMDYKLPDDIPVTKDKDTNNIKVAGNFENTGTFKKLRFAPLQRFAKYCHANYTKSPIKDKNLQAIREEFSLRIAKEGLNLYAPDVKIVYGKYPNKALKICMGSPWKNGLMEGTLWNGTLKDFALYTYMILVFGDYDAIGSKGQNMPVIQGHNGKIEPFAIDFGHALEKPGEKVNIKSMHYFFQCARPDGFISIHELLEQHIAGYLNIVQAISEDLLFAPNVKLKVLQMVKSFKGVNGTTVTFISSALSDLSSCKTAKFTPSCLQTARLLVKSTREKMQDNTKYSDFICFKSKTILDVFRDMLIDIQGLELIDGLKLDKDEIRGYIEGLSYALVIFIENARYLLFKYRNKALYNAMTNYVNRKNYNTSKHSITRSSSSWSSFKNSMFNR